MRTLSTVCELFRELESWQIIRVLQRLNIHTTTFPKARTLWTTGRFTVRGKRVQQERIEPGDQIEIASRMIGRHADHELRVFRDFAAVCGLGIEVASIQKRDPPEADILCRIADGSALAFEMVELVDRAKIAKPLADQEQLMDSLREASNEIPEETRKRLKNAWVGVKFRADRSLRKRKEYARQIVQQVAADPEVEGRVAVQEGDTEVAAANVKRREGLAGPHFRVIVAAHYNPIPIDSLDEKFDKAYQGDAPVHLLAHFNTQHAPLKQQIAELVAFIEANIERSNYRQVWIFDRPNQRLCYPNT